MNNEPKQKIKTIENKIENTRSALKIWANQISQYHKALKELTKQLEIIKQQITMNKDNINIKQNENNSQNQKGDNN